MSAASLDSAQQDKNWVQGDDAEAFARLANTRFSCRAFLSHSVPDAVIAKILETAQHSASWCNAQPWQIIVTRGAGTERFRSGIYRHASEHRPSSDYPYPREYHGVYRERRRECALQLYASLGITRAERDAANKQAMENYRLFGAPHVAIITSDEALGVYGAVDCGGFASSFALAAHSQGVATVIQAALASHPGFIREHFGLPNDRLIVCGISFGYADQLHPINGYRTTRERIAQSTTWVDE
jgi:nitroreductase